MYVTINLDAGSINMVVLSIEEHERYIDEAATKARESREDLSREYNPWEYAYNYITEKVGTAEWDVYLN